jgi:putative beta-lysine N-acetyltransferase
VISQAADRPERLAGAGYTIDVVVSDLNQRLQVLEAAVDDPAAAVAALDRRAREAGYGKVFWKARSGLADELVAAGLRAEATIDGYFNGDDATVVAAYLDPDRARRRDASEQDAILAAVRSRRPRPEPRPLPGGYAAATAAESDAHDLAWLYGEVFASYPFPISDPGYLIETMRSHVVYRIVRNGDGRLVAAASAETAPRLGNAEMTDFATLPDQRGLGLALGLLAALEDEMRQRGIFNLYTIARARSAGMNQVFANRGYRWTGTLVNNCHIAGRFEDMHVWCRHVA